MVMRSHMNIIKIVEMTCTTSFIIMQEDNNSQQYSNKWRTHFVFCCHKWSILFSFITKKKFSYNY